MESFLTSTGSWVGILGSVGLMLISHVANRYVIPFLKVGKRQKYAIFVATIADELTDDLRVQYPDKSWTQHLDELVDKLVAICGVDPQIARRVINAAASRKKS